MLFQETATATNCTVLVTAAAINYSGFLSTKNKNLQILG